MARMAQRAFIGCSRGLLAAARPRRQSEENEPVSSGRYCPEASIDGVSPPHVSKTSVFDTCTSGTALRVHPLTWIPPHMDKGVERQFRLMGWAGARGAGPAQVMASTGSRGARWRGKPAATENV
jgi:hypothetical protein